MGFGQPYRSKRREAVKLTNEEKLDIEEETFNEILFMIVELQLKTSRLYRLTVDCEPQDTNCPAKILVQSPKLKWEVIQEI